MPKVRARYLEIVELIVVRRLTTNGIVPMLNGLEQNTPRG